MTSLTHKEVVALIGDIGDTVIADIIATGTSAEELSEAHAWLANDEPLMNAGHPLPGGRVARLVDIMVAINEEDEAEEIARQS